MNAATLLDLELEIESDHHPPCPGKHQRHLVLVRRGNPHDLVECLAATHCEVEEAEVHDAYKHNGRAVLGSTAASVPWWEVVSSFSEHREARYELLVGLSELLRVPRAAVQHVKGRASRRVAAHVDGPDSSHANTAPC